MTLDDGVAAMTREAVEALTTLGTISCSGWAEYECD